MDQTCDPCQHGRLHSCGIYASVIVAALISLALVVKVSFAQNVNLMEHVTTAPEDVDKVWPDLSCHSDTFKRDVVKDKMDKCLTLKQNRPHYSICQKVCTITHLRLLKLQADNASLMTHSPSIKKRIGEIMTDTEVGEKLVADLATKCGEIYISYSFETRVDSSESEETPRVKRRPCKEWGDFVTCVDDAFKCPEQ